MNEFQRIAEFLNSQKVITRRLRWQTRSHENYASLNCNLISESPLVMRGKLVLTAHRITPKYGFAVLFQNKRIFALDVNPGRVHRNFFDSERIDGTHWHCWPHMEAEPDYRIMSHTQWLNEFMTRTKISCRVTLKSPPQGVQLKLWNL